MGKVRAFIACDIPEALLDKVSKVQDRLKAVNADVSWTRVAGIHLTLKFLGDIEEGQIDEVAAVIAGKSTGQPPFEIKIKGVGTFHGTKNPRVVWLGVEDAARGLSTLHDAMDGGLNALGFEPEGREFMPHLTLGRVKGSRGREELVKAVSELRELDIGSFNIDRVVLYRSDLKPTGAVYIKLKEVILGE